MATLLQIDFPHPGPWNEEMAKVLDGLARDISNEPGLCWKIWTENAAEGLAGGCYLFTDFSSAEAYLAKHRVRLKGFGYSDIRARIFDINQPLSVITGAPV
jgi:hypothetical protein